MTGESSLSNASADLQDVAAEKPPVIFLQDAFASGVVWGHARLVWTNEESKRRKMSANIA